MGNSFWESFGSLPSPIGQPGFGLPDASRLSRFDVAGSVDLEALRAFGVDVVVESGWERGSQPILTVWLDPEICKRQIRIILRQPAAEARFVLAGKTGAAGAIYVMGRRSLVIDGGNPIKNSAVHLSLWSDDCLFYWGKNATSNGLVSELMDDGRRLIFGEDCMLATEVMVRPTDMHAIFDLESLAVVNRTRSGQVVVHPHVWLGQRCMLLKDVEIGAGSIISSCSVVTGSIPSRSLAAGVPARIIRSNVSWTRHHDPSSKHLVDAREQLTSYENS